MAGCILYDEDLDVESCSNYSYISEQDIIEQIKGYRSKYGKFLVKKKRPSLKVNAACLNNSDSGFHDDDEVSISSSVLNNSYANIFENSQSFTCSSQIFDKNTDVTFKKPKGCTFTQTDDFKTRKNKNLGGNELIELKNVIITNNKPQSKSQRSYSKKQALRVKKSTLNKNSLNPFNSKENIVVKNTQLPKKLKNSTNSKICNKSNNILNKTLVLSDKSKVIKRDESEISKMFAKTKRILKSIENLSQSVNAIDSSESSLADLLKDIRFELRKINENFNKESNKVKSSILNSDDDLHSDINTFENNYLDDNLFLNNNNLPTYSDDVLLRNKSNNQFDLSQNSSVKSFENCCDLYFVNNNVSSSQSSQSTTYSLSDLTNSQEYIQKLSNTITKEDFNESSVVLIEAFQNTEEFIRNVRIKSIQETIVPDIDVEVGFINTRSLTNREDLLTEALLKIEQNPDLKFQEKRRTPKPSKAELLSRIRNVFTGLQEDSRNGKKLAVKLDRFDDWRNVVFEDDVLTCKKGGLTLTIRKITDGKRGCCKFKLVVYILMKIYMLLMTGSTCTKREIYYQILAYIKKQQQVNDAYNAVCCLLDAPPWILGIMPSGHGLVYGNLTLIINKTTIKCNMKGGVLIPQDVKDIRRIETDAKFILIVEKDSIFQKMLDENIQHKLSKPFILITGKGYPDTNTRFFIKKLSSHLKLPMFILVDADPFGIEIMLSYRFGSLTTSFLSRELALPNLRWIGVHPSEITLLNVDSSALSEHDRKKIDSVLTRPYMDHYPKIRQQLCIMKKRNMKAEIEGLIKYNQSLSNFYIPNKLCTQDFI